MVLCQANGVWSHQMPACVLNLSTASPQAVKATGQSLTKAVTRFWTLYPTNAKTVLPTSETTLLANKRLLTKPSTTLLLHPTKSSTTPKAINAPLLVTQQSTQPGTRLTINRGDNNGISSSTSGVIVVKKQTLPKAWMRSTSQRPTQDNVTSVRSVIIDIEDLSTVVSNLSANEQAGLKSSGRTGEFQYTRS